MTPDSETRVRVWKFPICAKISGGRNRVRYPRIQSKGVSAPALLAGSSTSFARLLGTRRASAVFRGRLVLFDWQRCRNRANREPEARGRGDHACPGIAGRLMIQISEQGDKRSGLDKSIFGAVSGQPLFGASRSQAAANALRARARRDMTVPIGRAVISEI